MEAARSDIRRRCCPTVPAAAPREVVARRAATTMSAAAPLCRLDEIADGAARGFDPQGSGQDTLFAVRRGQRLYLYRDSCPHASSPMAWRKDEYLNRRGDRILCFAHGAQFEVETGRCL